MTKKIADQVESYLKVFKLHCSSSQYRDQLYNIHLMYRSYFSCMQDLGLLTNEERLNLNDKLFEMLLEVKERRVE